MVEDLLVLVLAKRIFRKEKIRSSQQSESKKRIRIDTPQYLYCLGRIWGQPMTSKMDQSAAASRCGCIFPQFLSQKDSMTQLLSPCLQQAQTQWYSPLAKANMSQHSNKEQSKQDNQEQKKKSYSA